MRLQSLFATLISLTLVSASFWNPWNPRRRGFVYTHGRNFAIDGKKFYYFGANAYWFSFLSVCRNAVHIPLLIWFLLLTGHFGCQSRHGQGKGLHA